MKFPFLVAAILVCSVPRLSAGQDPPAQELLTSAAQQANLFDGQVVPFQLDVDFTVQIKVPVTGHLKLKWETKDRWWRQIDLGGFRETDIRSGNKLYTRRNTNYTPAGVKEILSLIAFADAKQNPGALAVKDEKRCRKNGEKAYCVHGDLASFGNESHEVCVNAATREILSDDWKVAPDQRRSEKFSNYIGLGGRRYPRTLELALNGNKIVSANVTGLVAIPFDESLLVFQPETVASLH